MDVSSTPRSQVTSDKRTNEVSTLFDDPSGGTMEPMVITRGEVDDTEEKGVSWSDTSSGSTSPAFDSRTRPHLGRHFNRFEQVLGGVLGVYHRCVGGFAKAAGWTMRVLGSGVGARGCISGGLGTRVGGTNQLGQTVLDSVDLSELAVEHDLMVGIGEGNPCAGRRFRGLDTKERVQGVGDSLDLLNLEILDGTEVKDGSVGRADLESKGRNINQVIKASKGQMIGGVTRRGESPRGRVS